MTTRAARRKQRTRSYITPELFLEMIRLRDRGYQRKDIAARVGVSEAAVGTYAPASERGLSVEEIADRLRTRIRRETAQKRESDERNGIIRKTRSDEWISWGARDDNLTFILRALAGLTTENPRPRPVTTEPSQTEPTIETAPAYPEPTVSEVYREVERVYERQATASPTEYPILSALARRREFVDRLLNAAALGNREESEMLFHLAEEADHLSDVETEYVAFAREHGWRVES